jgi:hypothetical protein
VYVSSQVLAEPLCNTGSKLIEIIEALESSAKLSHGSRYFVCLLSRVNDILNLLSNVPLWDSKIALTRLMNLCLRILLLLPGSRFRIVGLSKHKSGWHVHSRLQFVDTKLALTASFSVSLDTMSCRIPWMVADKISVQISRRIKRPYFKLYVLDLPPGDYQ